MARPKNQTPTYKLHSSTGLARCWVNGKWVTLGKYGSEESKSEFARVVAEHAANQTVSSSASSSNPRGPALTLDQVLVPYWAHVEQHYRTPEGKPTTEADEIRRSLAPVQRLYGHTLAAEFGPRALATVRQEMIKAKWCRTLVNHRIDRVKRLFRWAASEELVSVSVYHALRTLPGLQKGRTEARESDPVKPVDPAHVAAVLPKLNHHVRAMVELQRLTGMRPGEVCSLSFAEVDRSGNVWLFRPGKHKTAHRGKSRVVAFGPKAQAVLVAFLGGNYPPPAEFAHIDLTDDTARLVAADAYQEAGRERDAILLRDVGRAVAMISGCIVDPQTRVFSPIREQEERFRAMRAARKTKVQPSQVSRKKPNPQRPPGDKYRTRIYANAIAMACKKVGIPRWAPNQLRHLVGTEVRKSHGLEAVQVTLGHSHAKTSEIYAERDLALAVAVAAEKG